MFKRTVLFVAFIVMSAVGVLNANQAENAPLAKVSVCALTAQQLDTLARDGVVELAVADEPQVVTVAHEVTRPIAAQYAQ
jgi:hypothetical protein